MPRSQERRTRRNKSMERDTAADGAQLESHCTRAKEHVHAREMREHGAKAAGRHSTAVVACDVAEGGDGQAVECCGAPSSMYGNIRICWTQCLAVKHRGTATTHVRHVFSQNSTNLRSIVICSSGVDSISRAAWTRHQVVVSPSSSQCAVAKHLR